MDESALAEQLLLEYLLVLHWVDAELQRVEAVELAELALSELLVDQLSQVVVLLLLLLSPAVGVLLVQLLQDL